MGRLSLPAAPAPASHGPAKKVVSLPQPAPGLDADVEPNHLGSDARRTPS